VEENISVGEALAHWDRALEDAVDKLLAWDAVRHLGEPTVSNGRTARLRVRADVALIDRLSGSGPWPVRRRCPPGR
jgi:hypothetical protein